MKNWKYTSYKQLGKHHSICQDFVRVYDDESRMITCLCDGLGSLNNSHIAAETTVNTVIELFRTVSPEDPGSMEEDALRQLGEQLIGAVKERLKKSAAEQNVSPVSMDCTLLFVCIFKKENAAVLGNLGDSAVCVVKKSDSILFTDNAAGGVGTRAVQDEDAAQQISVTSFPLNDVLGFILTSDGLENEIYYKGMEGVCKGAELYFNALLSSIPQKVIQSRVRELTEDPDTIFDDDISIAVISCAAEPVVFEDDPTWPCVCGNNNPLIETFCTKCQRDYIDLYKNISFQNDRFTFFRNLRRDPQSLKELMEELKKADAENAGNTFTGFGDTEEEQTPAEPPAPAQPAAQSPAGNGNVIYSSSQSAREPQGAPPNYAVNDARQQAALEAKNIPAGHGAKSFREKNPLTPYAILFMAIAFVVGGFLGAMIMAAVKNNSIAELEDRLRHQPSQAATEEATSPYEPHGVSPDGDETVQPPEDTTVAPHEGIEGVWNAQYCLLNGERRELSEGLVVNYKFEFHENNTVTRYQVEFHNSADEGTYRHVTENGDYYILNFGSEEMSMEYNSEEKTLTLIFPGVDVKTVYFRADASETEETQPQASEARDTPEALQSSDYE